MFQAKNYVRSSMVPGYSHTYRYKYLRNLVQSCLFEPNGAVVYETLSCSALDKE